MPSHFIAFWNVENLFGPEHHPPRIPWIADKIAGDLEGWSEALFNRKIAQLARIIAMMNDGAGPDILGVCEVEDAVVLRRLADAVTAVLPARQYEVIHVDGAREKRGVDTAFLYDPALYTVDPNLIFSHFVLRRTGTRDILQSTFRTMAGHDLVLMANHWPSRGGGAEASAGFRATAGETLAYWHERILEETGEDTPIIAMGDMNDDPWDGSVKFNALGLRERGDVERGRTAKFYNLAWEYLTYDAVDHRGTTRRLDGTLYYKSDGNVFDQILVNRPILTGAGPLTLIPGSARVEAFPPMVSHKVGSGPIRFGLPKGDVAANVNPDGFSDHFPVSLQIAEA